MPVYCRKKSKLAICNGLIVNDRNVVDSFSAYKLKGVFSHQHRSGTDCERAEGNDCDG